MRRLWLPLMFALIATGPQAASTPFALQNERLFFLDFKRGEITGAYNPAGYSSSEVEKVLEWMCGRGRLMDITESSMANGLREVAVTCRLSDITGYGRAEIRGRGKGKTFDATYRGTTKHHGHIFRERTF